jgi:hypothetical protein
LSRHINNSAFLGCLGKILFRGSGWFNGSASHRINHFAFANTSGGIIDFPNFSLGFTLCVTHNSLARINGIFKTALGLGSGIAPTFFISGGNIVASLRHCGDSIVTGLL